MFEGNTEVRNRYRKNREKEWEDFENRLGFCKQNIKITKIIRDMNGRKIKKVIVQEI